jgi:hypothetical protein
MWLVLAAAALICDPPGQELGLRVLDANGAVVPGAEVRKWSGREPREALLGVTDASGSLTTCVSAGTGPLGVYSRGFRPEKLTPRAGQIVVKLEIADPILSAVTAQGPPCVTGSKDGSYRLCGDDLKRLPLRD